MKLKFRSNSTRIFLLLFGLSLTFGIQAKELKLMAPRAPLSELKLPDLNGKTHSLADYKGKVV